jgi:hypothetical protein
MSQERGRDPPARVLRTAYNDDGCQSIDTHEAAAAEGAAEAVHFVATTSGYPRRPRNLEDSSVPLSPTVPTDDGPRYKDQARDCAESPEAIPRPPVRHSPAVGLEYKDQVRPFSARALNDDDALPLVMAVAVVPEPPFPMDHNDHRIVAPTDVTTEAAAAAATFLTPNSATVDDGRPSPRVAASEAVDTTRRASPPRSPNKNHPGLATDGPTAEERRRSDERRQMSAERLRLLLASEALGTTRRTSPPRSPVKNHPGVATDGPTAEERRRSDERRQMSAERLHLLFGLEQKPQQEDESLHSTSNFGSPTQRGNHDNALRRLRLSGEWADQQPETRRGSSYKLPYRYQPRRDTTTGPSRPFVPTTNATPDVTR